VTTSALLTSVTRLGWSVAELSAALGVSKGFLRKEIRAGALPVRRLGRRVLVLNEDVQGYLKQRQARLDTEAAPAAKCN
jgi:excisionase family DNA binding protein